MKPPPTHAAKQAGLRYVGCSEPGVLRINIPGQRLFQYVDSAGNYQPISSSDINGYLRRVTGIDVTAKTFRTWTATLLAVRQFAGFTLEESQAALKRQVNEVLAVVASELGNTPAICRKSYVDPRVIDAYLNDELKRCTRGATRRAGLSAEECRLLAILEASGGGAERKAA